MVGQYPILQERLIERLMSLHQKGRLPASLLITGQKGVGKWPMVRELARAITCLESQADVEANCASCRQCRTFSHPDIHYLFPLPGDAKRREKEKSFASYLEAKESNPFGESPSEVTQFIPIDAIRDFQNSLARKPSLSPHKIGIVYEAERMLPAAMDSLLKLLEEPPARTYLFIVTDQARLLLPTILSRLQRVFVPPLEESDISQFLTERLQLDTQQATVVARLAGGTLFNIEAIAAGDFLTIRNAAFDLFTDGLKMPRPLLMAKHIENPQISSRDRVESLIPHWRSFLRDLMLISIKGAGNADSTNDLLTYPDLQSTYAECCRNIDHLEAVAGRLERLEGIQSELRRNVNPRLAALSFLCDLRDISV